MSILSLPFLLTLLLGTASYWALPRAWRLPCAAAAAWLALAWVAPVAAAHGLVLGAASHALGRRGCRLGVAYAAAAGMFVALLLLRELLARSGSGSVVVPWFGAAFCTLRAAHHVIASAQGRAPEHRAGDYFCYLFFPPTLVVGPFQGFADFEREARRSRFDAQRFSAGLERLLFGYAKVVLLANYLVGLKLERVIEAMAPGATRTYLECLSYGLTLYFKFAGYSDVAIGSALLLGLRLPENFDHPFTARNIADFWRRWHASVSGWCRDHVSFPLYAVTRSLALSSLVAMLVLGLWHECSARYLLWGAYHGVGILAWQRWRRWVDSVGGWPTGAAWRHATDLLARGLTFNFVIVGFAITRTDDVGLALRSLRQLLVPWL